MIHTSDISNKVISRIQEWLGVEKRISANSRLYEDLGADSLDCVEIAMELEEEFSIKISNDETDHFETVQDFISLVEKKL